ncbi:MAG: RecX family transcriptional regulator [Clostridia bacterium]|nr:RecX family transcriptional regulator [Clostridia bacterium]
MSEITSIEPQKKDKERCNVYVDGRFYCGIKLEVAIKFHLKAGMQIEKSRLDEIQLETEKSQAMDKALTHLSASMKTKKQMRDFLAKKGYTEAVINYVLERLEYHKFVDDYAYCRAYVQSVTGKGKRALEVDLFKRGAEKDAIEAALSEAEEDTDEAAAILTKYMRGKVADKQTLYKAFKYLLSKGYGYETAKSALEAFGDVDEDN